MFQAAGITAPPNDMDELLADAIKLNTPDHAGFCVRADKSQTLYDGFQLWNHFIPYDNPITGTYFDKNWNFLIGTEPNASAYGQFYRDILTKAAPAGIATYLVTNCLADFQQGRVAMWQDDSGNIPDVLDPDKSKVANDAKFWEIPCQPVNPDNCALVQPFGIWINAASEHKDAAWLLVQYITSKETQVNAVAAKALLTPSRNSVITDPATTSVLPPTFATALTYILAHPDAALLPFIPEAVSLIPPISDGQSNLITTTTPVADIMATMKSQEDAIMKRPQGIQSHSRATSRGSLPRLARPDRIVATTTDQTREAPGSGGFSLSRVLDRHFLVAAAWPSLIVMALVTAIPFVLTLGLSLTNYDLIRAGWQFIGFDNFAQLAADPNTQPVVINTIYLVLATTIIDTTIGLGSGSVDGVPVPRDRHHSQPLPAADHDRRRDRRHDLAGDVQQQCRLDQLLPGVAAPATAALARRSQPGHADGDHLGRLDWHRLPVDPVAGRSAQRVAGTEGGGDRRRRVTLAGVSSRGASGDPAGSIRRLRAQVHR